MVRVRFVHTRRLQDEVNYQLSAQEQCHKAARTSRTFQKFEDTLHTSRKEPSFRGENAVLTLQSLRRCLAWCRSPGAPELSRFLPNCIERVGGLGLLKIVLVLAFFWWPSMFDNSG